MDSWLSSRWSKDPTVLTLIGRDSLRSFEIYIVPCPLPITNYLTIFKNPQFLFIAPTIKVVVVDPLLSAKALGSLLMGSGQFISWMVGEKY